LWQSLEELKLKHEAEMKTLKEDLEKERLLYTQQMKTSVAAEKQVINKLEFRNLFSHLFAVS